MRRFPCALAIVLVVLLSGCAMPVSVQIASFVADTISWFSTDKTISDHAISLALGKDCSVLRTFSGDDICRDQADNSTTVATVKADKVKKIVTADNTASGNQIASSNEASSQEAPQMLPIAIIQAKPAAAENGKLHFVLASFSVVENARRLVDGNPRLSPDIVTVKVLDKTMHRVVVGPFIKEERKTLARRIAKAGFKDAWVVRMKINRPLHDHPPGSQLAEDFQSFL